jgi:hypothetical protein
MFPHGDLNGQGFIDTARDPIERRLDHSYFKASLAGRADAFEGEVVGVVVVTNEGRPVEEFAEPLDAVS